MDLDDAIHAARFRAESLDSQPRQHAERLDRERKDAAELLEEAVRRLSPYKGGIFGKMRQCAFGRFRGSDGRRYTIAERHRCWLLVSMEGVHPQTEVW
ncbi:hypothetical protein DT019_27115 [Streptomyces sp. SDr-06]|uniref:hypothetical protein n=1 Tax=Streptomyces sp. SDr-06 TaxID=2267702 RepID=UPI000DE945F4|nr:hypothetical protein [Streptomyces sp. SDr-06]RCH65473.1 hypothetical protein DT019_27115 [Streptomyces sp. SDr-06]